MSRIGKLAIDVPAGVNVDIAMPTVTVKGPKGTLSVDVQEEIDVVVEDEKISVKRRGESKRHRSLHGLTRTLIANMITGVSQGFSKKLQVVGIGYRVLTEPDHIVLYLGYSNPVNFPIPDGIEIDVDKQNNITVSGIDKQLVGQVAANIRELRRVEPYKGKGIRYEGEEVIRKLGKAKLSKG